MPAFSVSVYPCHHFDEQIEDIRTYLHVAKQHGCREVFSSGHLPEYPLEEQISCLYKLGQITKQEQLELTVDFGGASLKEILYNETLKMKVKDIGIDFLRLDYGYEASIMEALIHELGITGFVWNASIMKEAEVDQHWAYIQQFPAVRIRACHNFYPRKDTGLDASFVIRQSSYFQKYQIPVTVCIAAHTQARGPLMEGLPTIERQRDLPLARAAFELMLQKSADTLLIGDEFISEQEMQELQAILNREPLLLHVHLEPTLSFKEEAALLEAVHQIRYDSNSFILRSQSSRQMAEFASKVSAGKTKERLRGCITMDNERYERYSGEIQFVLQDLPADPRVNVIGHIEEQDMWKLDGYQEGFDYRLVKL